MTAETNAAVDLIFGYTGKQLDDATGLQHNLFRWYDSALGQWLSEDPMGFAAGDENLKRYVGNGVTTRKDSFGLWEEIPESLKKLIAFWAQQTQHYPPHTGNCGNCHSPIPPTPFTTPYFQTYLTQDEYFWAGFTITNQAYHVSTYLGKWANTQDIPVYNAGSFRYLVTYNMIGVNDLAYRRYSRIGRAQEFTETDVIDLGLVYNELFHAYFDQVIEELRAASWVLELMNSQLQYSDSTRIHMVEEAMSETIGYVVTNHLQNGWPIPEYAVIDTEFLSPGHNEIPDDIWYGNSESHYPMTQEMYNATMWILMHGATNGPPQ